MKKIIFPLLCLILVSCDMERMQGNAGKESPKQDDTAAQLKQINEKLDKISAELAALKTVQPAAETPKEETQVDDTSLLSEREKAKIAYDMVGKMLADAVAYQKRTGNTPEDTSQLAGNYELDGFRADINYNGPSLFRVKDGRDVYRIHFIAPYSYHYNAYPDIRKICDSDYKEYFVDICGYLAGKDVSGAEKNEYGYFRLGLD